MRAIGVLALGWLFLGKIGVQASPAVVNTNLQLSLILNTPTDSTSVRIAKDPRNNQLYYLKINGDIYQVNLANSTSSKVYSIADHGLSGAVEGLAIGPDGTMYVLGDSTTNNGNYGFVRIMKGVLDNSGARAWSLLAQTDIWPRSKGAFDHNCSALIVSLDGQYLYFNAGSRTDHGEVQDAGGLFPNTRDVALTAKIFRLPVTGSNLFLTNDLTALLNAGYVFAQGTRNAFDFAFAPNGDLFATENGPDRDMSDSLYWLRQGLHYGFPWRMGGMDNPQQFPTYNPSNDLLLNTNYTAVQKGYYHNDPTFPPPPTNFTDPVISLGPDADEYRDPVKGSITNASQQDLTLTTFTAHRSPLGLVFDTAGALAPPFQYHGFMLSWTAGDPNGDSVDGPFDDPGQDLVDLNMTKLGNTNYQTQVTRIVGGFSNPIDAEIIGNKIYVIEYGGNQGLWEITFPPAQPPTFPSTTTVTSSQNPAPTASVVTFTATVSGTGGIPTGSVTFFDSGSSVGNATLNSSGLAAFSTSTLSASGSPHSIMAVYGGDSTFIGSGSSVLSQVITNTSTAPLPTDITNGLVAYYALASNGNDSLAGNNLMLMGSPAFSSGAINWNGSVPTYGYSSPQQWPQSGLTVSGWINMSNPNANYVVAACYGNASGSLSAAYMQFFTWSKGLTARVVQNIDANYIGRSTPSILTAGWHFVAFTWAGGTSSSSIKVYLDGSQVDNADNKGGSFTGVYSGNNVPLSVGAQLSGGYGLGGKFTGSQKGVRVYNRALSATSIGTLYSNGVNNALY